MDSIRLGDHRALGTLSILSDAQALTITYKLGGGTVSGTIDSCRTGYVFQIPQEPALRHAGFMRLTTCGQNGRFELSRT